MIRHLSKKNSPLASRCAKTCLPPLLTACCAVALTLLSGCGVHQVVPAATPGGEGRGAGYYLPRTVLVATVPVTRTVSEPGPLRFYCLPLLQRETSITASSATFSVGKETALEIAGERDPSQKYIAIYPKGFTKTFTQTLAFNEQGVLSKGDGQVENKTVEFVVSSIEGAAKIASAAIKPAGGVDREFPLRPGLKELLDHINSLDAAPAPDLTLGALRVGLATLLADKPEEKLEALGKQAEGDPVNGKELSGDIELWRNFAQSDLKGFREMFAATNSFKDMQRVEAALQGATAAADRAALGKERDAILERFLGGKKEITWIGQFRWVPSERQENQSSGTLHGEKSLLSIGPKGLQFQTSPEIPPSADFKKPLPSSGSSSEKTTAVALTYNSIIPDETSQWAALLDNRQKHGWHYRIPAQAIVNLTVGGARQISKRTFIAQHGCIAFVPATSAGQKVVSIVELDPATGALKSVTHGGQSFDPALASRTGTAIAGVVEAQQARAAADAAANDPLAQLERKKKILEAKKGIRDLGGEAD
jgi:hypothetical protein